MSCAFAAWNALSWLGDQMKSFFVLRRGRSGISKEETVLVEVDNWFTNPKKDRRSVRLVGVGKFEIASVIDLST